MKSGEDELEDTVDRLRSTKLNRRIRLVLYDTINALRAMLFRRSPAGIIDGLTRELAEMRYNYQKISEQNEQLRGERNALQHQLTELLNGVDLDAISTLQRNAAEAGRLMHERKHFEHLISALRIIVSRFRINRLFAQMENEFSDAIDSFQRIKILRNYLSKFSEIIIIQKYIQNFMSDKELVKNKAEVENLFQYLRQQMDYTSDFLLLIERNEDFFCEENQ